MRRWVSVLNVVLTLVVLAAAIAAVAALGQAGDGRLEAVAQFAPVYAGIGLLGVAWAIAAGRGPVVAAGVVALVASGWLVAPEFARDVGPVAPPAAPGQIKVIQFNALSSNRQIARIADWLGAQDAAFITVTEARHDLRDLMFRRGWRVAGSRGDLMIFTREPYLRMDRPRPRDIQRITYVNATYATRSGEAEVFTTHVDRGMRDGRATMPAKLAGLTEGLPARRMILSGDFNTTPWSVSLRRADATLGLIRRDRAVPTWPAQVLGQPWPLPFLPIDHVYAGPGWATVKVERGPYLGSDHYPLIVTLAPFSPR